MQDRYASGNKVYNGGLPNAHSGTLNPSGYIDRESNRRSQLAAIAMARRDQPQANGKLPATKKNFNAAGLMMFPNGSLRSMD